MKYILRIIASIPAICIGISMILLFTMSFDYPIFIILTIGDAIGMFIILLHFESIVKELKKFVSIMAKDTLCYDE